MSVTVQLMSGKIYSFDIFDGYRIRNLRYEVYTVIRNEDRSFTDSERIVFSNKEYEHPDDMDYVNDGDHYYIFVKEEDEIPRIRLTLGENGVMCLRHQNGQLIRYYGWNVSDMSDVSDVSDIKEAILEVDIEDIEDAYNVMRQDIRFEVDDGDDYDDEILEDLDNDRIIEMFCERFVGIRIHEIVMV